MRASEQNVQFKYLFQKHSFNAADQSDSFQTFFIFLKKKNNKTNSDHSIIFSELSYYFYLHQLYAAFIMMIKEQSFNDEEYFEDKIRVSKIIIVIMI